MKFCVTVFKFSATEIETKRCRRGFSRHEAVYRYCEWAKKSLKKQNIYNETVD